ncbi:MAG TPA: hypothetical protein VIH55_06635, partial [Acidimicrobiia bacterium]
MASRLRATIVAIAVLLAACTSTGTVTPLPPDMFAPTPSIGGVTPSTTIRPDPTTTANVERAMIYPVDPLTLDALPGFNPIPMGDWVWGHASSNGAYFVAVVGDDDSGLAEIRLIDVAAWEQIGSWRGAPASEPLVTDDGTIHYVGGIDDLIIIRGGTSEVSTTLPTGWYPSGAGQMINGRFVSFGATSGAGTGLDHGSIIAADIDAGSVTDIDLATVRIGSLEPDADEPWGGYLYAFPAVALDAGRSRALVVHADRDVVSVVDLDSGSVTDHEFSPTGSNPSVVSTTSILSRSAAISADGSHLYVATQVGEIDVDDEVWTFTTTPTGVITIDTATWRIISSLQQPIGSIQLSPDGTRILGTGYTGVEGSDTSEVEMSGL